MQGFLQPNRTNSSYSSLRGTAQSFRPRKFSQDMHNKRYQHGMFQSRAGKSYNQYQSTYQREMSRVPQRQVTKPWLINNRTKILPAREQYYQIDKPGVNLVLDNPRTGRERYGNHKQRNLKNLKVPRPAFRNMRRSQSVIQRDNFTNMQQNRSVDNHVSYRTPSIASKSILRRDDLSVVSKSIRDRRGDDFDSGDEQDAQLKQILINKKDYKKQMMIQDQERMKVDVSKMKLLKDKFQKKHSPSKFRFQKSASGHMIPVFKPTNEQINLNQVQIDEMQGQQGEQADQQEGEEEEEEEELQPLDLSEDQIQEIEELLSLNKNVERISFMLQIEESTLDEYIRRKSLPKKEPKELEQVQQEELPQNPKKTILPQIPNFKLDNQQYKDQVQEIDDIQSKINQKYGKIYEMNQEYFDKLTDTRVQKKRVTNYSSIQNKPWMSLKTKYSGYKTNYQEQYSRKSSNASLTQSQYKRKQLIKQDFYTQKIKPSQGTNDYSTSYNHEYVGQQEKRSQGYPKQGIFIPKQVQFSTSEYQNRYPNYMQSKLNRFYRPQQQHGLHGHVTGAKQVMMSNNTFHSQHFEKEKRKDDLRDDVQFGNGVVVNHREFNNVSTALHSKVKFKHQNSHKNHYKDDGLRKSQQLMQNDPKKVQREWTNDKQKHLKKQLYHQFCNNYNTTSLQYGYAQDKNKHPLVNVPINSSNRKHHSKEINDQQIKRILQKQLLEKHENERKANRKKALQKQLQFNQ